MSLDIIYHELREIITRCFCIIRHIQITNNIISIGIILDRLHDTIGKTEEETTRVLHYSMLQNIYGEYDSLIDYINKSDEDDPELIELKLKCEMLMNSLNFLYHGVYDNLFWRCFQFYNPDNYLEEIISTNINAEL